MMAQGYGKSPAEIESLNIRPPVKPVTLAALASMAERSE